MNYETTKEIELAVASYFDTRQKLIVPNISWGLCIHECDLLIVSNSGYATEVEIKISLSDLKADRKKEHEHKSNRIKYLYFAIPEKLKDYIYFIPERSGVITVKQNGSCEILKEPKYNEGCIKLTNEEILHCAKLGCMRFWNLKRKIIYENQKDIKL